MQHNTRRILAWSLGLWLLAGLLGSEAGATAITDATNDLIPSFTLGGGGDLDIIAADVIFDGNNFTVYGKLNANVGTTAGTFFVWGIDRGLGTARFGAVAPAVLFDSVVSINLNPGQASVVRELQAGGATNALAANQIIVTGNEIRATFSKTLLPLLTGGVTSVENYTYNLWTRRIVGADNQLADFAPDPTVRNAQISTPEPSTFALAAVALAALGFRRLRSKSAA